MQTTSERLTEVSFDLRITVDPVAWAKFSESIFGSARQDIYLDFAPPKLQINDDPFWVRKWRKGVR